VDGADRHDEAQTIGGGYVAAAPSMGKRDAVLGGDQGGIGPGERLGPDVVLPHPAQPRAAQRWRITPAAEQRSQRDQRLEPGVAGFGQQHGANARRNIAGACAALAGVGELASKAGAGVHLQQQLWQVHPRQAYCDRCPECDQAGGLLQLVESRQHQVVAVHLHGSVFGQVRRCVPVSGIQASR